MKWSSGSVGVGGNIRACLWKHVGLVKRVCKSMWDWSDAYVGACGIGQMCRSRQDWSRLFVGAGGNSIGVSGNGQECLWKHVGLVESECRSMKDSSNV